MQGNLGSGFLDSIVWFFSQIALVWYWSPAPEEPAIPEYWPPDVYVSPDVPLTPAVETQSDAVRFVSDKIVHGWDFVTVLEIWGIWFWLAFTFGMLISVSIIYSVIRTLQIRHAEKRAYEAGAHPVASEDIPRSLLRWHRILEQMNSDDEHKWRLAILEADIMLNDLLDTLGYKGETMADKMKQVSRPQFNTIDSAWEAHKVRNRIAHEGAEHSLTHREAQRVIRQYEQVFREFDFIE